MRVSIERATNRRSCFRRRGGELLCADCKLLHLAHNLILGERLLPLLSWLAFALLPRLHLDELRTEHLLVGPVLCVGESCAAVVEFHLDDSTNVVGNVVRPPWPTAGDYDVGPPMTPNEPFRRGPPLLACRLAHVWRHRRRVERHFRLQRRGTARLRIDPAQPPGDEALFL